MGGGRLSTNHIHTHTHTWPRDPEVAPFSPFPLSFHHVLFSLGVVSCTTGGRSWDLKGSAFYGTTKELAWDLSEHCKVQVPGRTGLHQRHFEFVLVLERGESRDALRAPPITFIHVGTFRSLAIHGHTGVTSGKPSSSSLDLSTCTLTSDPVAVRT